MAKKGYREESDSIGIVYVPRKALYGAQTQRAINNFPISGIKMDFPFTKSWPFGITLKILSRFIKTPTNKIPPINIKLIEAFL